MTEFSIDDLKDREAIRALIYTYCRSVDRLDVPLGHSIWHDDGVADYGTGFYQGPGKGVIDRICARHADFITHSHQVTNILIALDGDDAGSESYVTATMRMIRDGKCLQFEIRGRYLDRWQRRVGRWGLVHRAFAMDHSSTREVAPGPDMGVTATRDRSDPSYARLERPS